jgi:hypothetical protein
MAKRTKSDEDKHVLVLRFARLVSALQQLRESGLHELELHFDF